MSDYFPRIDSEDSARAAIKMAGLPVFLTGASLILQAGLAALFALQLGAAPQIFWLACAIFVVLGLVLLFASLKLRKGKGIAIFVPLAVMLSLFNIAALFAGNDFYTLKARIIMATFPALLVLLSVHGVRGWLWLARNKRRR